MYPYFRAFVRGIVANRKPKIGFLETTSTKIWIGPLDIDPWMELNNGRTLTLYDLGRIPHFQQTGTTKPILKAGMYLTVAGVSVRYRGRIRPFTTAQMQTRVLGWDNRFVYVEQSLWQNGECANQMLLRPPPQARSSACRPSRSCRICRIRARASSSNTLCR